MDLKKIANPFTVFSIAWSLCLFLYSLGWAGIFPKISQQLFVFLVVVIIVFGVTGIFFNKLKENLKVTHSLPSSKSVYISVTINTIFWVLNFMYSGVPLLKGIRVDDFGIPTLIVIATSFNCFLAIYCFYIFLLSKKYIYILLCLYCLIFFVLVFSRGNIMMTLMSMFFLWLNIKSPKLSIKKTFSIALGLLSVMYLFGVAGNYRSINDLYDKDPSFDKSYNSNVILFIGDASDSFKSSIVPGEFFWTYLYLTSPLSNLQYNIDKNHPSTTMSGLSLILIDEVLFDTFSKRVDRLLNRTRRDPDLIVDQLTVPTILTGSYNYAGWVGMIFFLSIFWILPIVYILCVLQNQLSIIGISVLCTIYFFSIFDNTLILTGLTSQIIYPIIINIFNKISLKPATDL